MTMRRSRRKLVLMAESGVWDDNKHATDYGDYKGSELWRWRWCWCWQQRCTQGNTEIIKEREPVANGVVDNDDEKEAKCWLPRTSLATTRSTQEITEITEEGRRKMPPTCNLDQPLETSSYACLELHASCLWRWYIVRNSSQWHSTETKFFCQSRFVSTSWCGIQSGFRDSDRRSFNSDLAFSLGTSELWCLTLGAMSPKFCTASVLKKRAVTKPKSWIFPRLYQKWMRNIRKSHLTQFSRTSLIFFTLVNLSPRSTPPFVSNLQKQYFCELCKSHEYEPADLSDLRIKRPATGDNHTVSSL